MQKSSSHLEYYMLELVSNVCTFILIDLPLK